MQPCRVLCIHCVHSMSLQAHTWQLPETSSLVLLTTGYLKGTMTGFCSGFLFPFMWGCDFKWKNIQTTFFFFFPDHDLWISVRKSVGKLLNCTENNRLIQLMRWCRIKHKQSWCCENRICNSGGCYKKTCENRASHNYLFLIFSLPSLPKVPRACPDSSRECSRRLRRRYAKTNYQFHWIIPKKD